MPAVGSWGSAAANTSAAANRSRAPLADRLKVIFEQLSQVAALYRPEAVAVEGLFSFRNARSALVLALAPAVGQRSTDTEGHLRLVQLYVKILADEARRIKPFDSQIDPYSGFHSAQEKRAAYERFVSHAQHGSVVMIENARHFVMFDRPATFQAALLAAILKQP